MRQGSADGAALRLILFPIYLSLVVVFVGGFWVGHALACLPGLRRGDFVARWHDRPDGDTLRGWARIVVGASVILLVAAVLP
jgi:hypothetical protein